MSTPMVLIAIGDPLVRKQVRACLVRDGKAVEEAETGTEALTKVERHHYDLMVLDVALPGTDGWEVCRRIRATSDLPILMLTEPNEYEQRIIGLNLGADACMSRPVNCKELVFRAKAILRRTYSRQPQSPDQLQYGSLVVDTRTRTVEIDGSPVTLTRTEFRLLCELATNPGVVCSRDYLLERIWGYRFSGETRTVDVHVTKLRVKLGKVSDLIGTVRGAGYRLETAGLRADHLGMAR